MNQFWKDLGQALALGLALPAFLLWAAVTFSLPERQTADDMTTASALETTPLITAQQERRITLLMEDGKTQSIELTTYLTGVVLAEMPVSFEDEAIKAQAVVARTYALRALNGGSKHDGAAVCDQAACCQGYLAADQFIQRGGTQEQIQRIGSLVAATDPLTLTYENAYIEATYFSCSGGRTEDAVAVWGADVPYLRSVASPGEEEAAYYTDTVTFTQEEFAEKLDLVLGKDPSQWLGKVTYTAGGGVDTVVIGGKTFSGTQLRKLLKLRSTSFDLSFQDAAVVITTRGYGHRVGMSQYGANAMAASGSTFDEILAYYYQGTELTPAVD